MKKEAINSGRLRWLCRRGMLELDVILENFLDKGYAQLNSSEQEQFQALLELPDPVLYHWLIASEQPDAEEWLLLVNKIRQTI